MAQGTLVTAQLKTLDGAGQQAQERFARGRRKSLKTYRGAPSDSISTVSPASAWARMEANCRWKLRNVVFMSDETMSDKQYHGKRGAAPDQRSFCLMPFGYYNWRRAVPKRESSAGFWDSGLQPKVSAPRLPGAGRLPEPNPNGVAIAFSPDSQGGSCRAILGWAAEPLWNSEPRSAELVRHAKPPGEQKDHSFTTDKTPGRDRKMNRSPGETRSHNSVGHRHSRPNRR